MDTTVEQKLDTFFSQFRTVSFKKNEVIITSGEELTSIYYLKKGLVKQVFITENGEEITHHVFKPISFFPIMLVLSHTPNVYNFVALEDLSIQKAPVEKVVSFLKAEPDVLFDLTTRFAQGLQKLLIKNEQTLFKDAYAKVASLLLYLGQRFGTQQANDMIIPLPTTHNDIASWLGLQRETVSRQIEKLQKKGMIVYQKNILIIPDLSLLEKEIS